MLGGVGGVGGRGQVYEGSGSDAVTEVRNLTNQLLEESRKAHPDHANMQQLINLIKKCESDHPEAFNDQAKQAINWLIENENKLDVMSVAKLQQMCYVLLNDLK